MRPATIELRDVKAAYGDIEVLHGIDLRLERGKMLAVLGPNGAGKSTLLKLIAGLLRPTGGEVVLDGQPTAGVGAAVVAQAGVRLVPDSGATFPNLTVRENLTLAPHARQGRAAIEEQAYARFPVLGARRRQLAGTLSGGEQQMLAVARALAGEPQLILLDELSTGLAPLVVAELLEHVQALTVQGITVVVVEQFARAVLPIADLAGVLVKGRLHVGLPGDIGQRLHDAYLGRSMAGLAAAT